MNASIQSPAARSLCAGGHVLALCAAAALLAMTAQTTFAGGGRGANPGVHPPTSHPYGMSYSEWAAAWWQWAYSIPNDQSPITDTTGEFSGVGQNGPVYFLAGTYGGTVTRTIEVPAGKSLLFPLLNQSWVQFPTDPPFTIPELREIIAPFVDNPILTCVVDGKPLHNLLAYREQSVVFSVTVPDNNALGLEPGTYAPCVDDGYYLMLAPLSVGSHTIHFTASNADETFHLDVTYYITVTAH